MRYLSLCLVASACLAQPTVAPTDVPTAPARGENVGGYNITNSFETGYRFRSVGGDLGRYRSDVNFGNGLRLLSGTLNIHSREGHGKYFDKLLFTTRGLGNDPYQFTSFTAEKNRIYQYDFTWRLNEYFNPAIPLASGQHLRDTTRTLSDHNIVLLPQSPFRIFAGYSRVNQNGAGLNTVNLFDIRGDEFPLFTNVRRSQDAYRLGFELAAFGAKFSVLRGWEFFKDDSRLTSGAHPGNSLTNPASLSGFRRDEPYHGATSWWRTNLLWDRSRTYTVNARYTYADGRRDFIFDESALGTDRFGAARNRQILVFGNGRRPVTTAALTVSVFPGQRINIVNHTAYHNTRIEGDASWTELSNSVPGLTLFEFQLLGIRTLTSQTDLNYRISGGTGAFAGYQFSTRRINTVDQSVFDGSPDRFTANQTNRLHAGRFGFRIQPSRAFSLVLDSEIGRADRPIYPISDRNYHAYGGRVRYRTRNLQVSAMARTGLNTNSVSLFSHSARTRTWGGDLSWNGRAWLSLDASYSNLYSSTLTGIAYFYDFRLIQNDRSVWRSNIHSAYAGLRIQAGPRVETMLGYSRTQDTANDGRPGPAAPTVLGVAQPPLVAGNIGTQFYPLTFESPLARVSVRLRNQIRWNAGYQHYRYSERLLPLQNYRAHTGYTSLSWSF